MAARTTDAAASLSPDRTVFSCFLSCKSQCFCTYSSRLTVLKRAYSREFLLDVGRTTFLELNSPHAEELRDLGLLRRPTSSPTPTTASRPQRRRYKRCERKQKRGKRGGIRARLAANLHKPAIPTIVGVSLPSLQDIYSTRLTRKALSIAGDPTHPTHSFFSLLPSGRRLRSLQARTSRLKDSFIHQAVRKLNSLPSLPPLPSFTPRNLEL